MVDSPWARWGGTHAPGYGNVTISYNKIFNVMSKMKDGGGIYVNGVMRGVTRPFSGIARSLASGNPSVMATQTPVKHS
jgi:hypothetical protein